jgi:hypothetical protein
MTQGMTQENLSGQHTGLILLGSILVAGVGAGRRGAW